jgi:hypothetical protein
MVIRNSGVNYLGNLQEIAGPSQCLNEIIEAWTEYQKVVEQEKSKRCAISA